MTRQKYILSDRKSLNSETGRFENNDHGFYFNNECTPRNEPADLTNFEILHTGVDTLEPKFKGLLKPEIVNQLFVETQIDDYYGTKKEVFNEYPRKVISLNGLKFRFHRAPFDSGYRYQLQNESVGILIFFGYLSDTQWLIEQTGLKIKLSPQLIYNEGLPRCAEITDDFANFFFDNFEYAGLRGDLCMDVQGWEPERDFLYNLRTRSRVKRAIPSAGSSEGFIDLTKTELDHSDIAIRYDHEKSFLIGKQGVQTRIYSKLEESKRSNKFKFWDSVYSQHLCFDKSKDVFRIEGSFPSNVLLKLGLPAKGGATISHEIKSIADFIPHIPSLWRHMLYEQCRYVYPDSKVIRPEWQYLAESPFMNIEDEKYQYQRLRVTHSGNDSDRNIAQLLGHLASYCAKEDVPNEKIEEMLYSFPQISVINKYFREKGQDSEQWINAFIEKVDDRRLDLAPIYETPFKNIKSKYPQSLTKPDDDYIPGWE
ncbi:hypothetical protein JCM30760_07720 [Thiomicrorhabdus hydrogeniphila]